MKLISVTAFAFLVNIAAADSPPSRSHDHHNIGLGGELIGDAHDDVNGSIPPSTPELAAPVADSNWDKALASGSKLHVTLPLSDKLASWYWKTDPHHNDPNVQTVQSPYDGDMKELFRHWGYKEPSEEKQLINIDKDCDFEGSHKLKRAFDDLGIGTKSKLQGGPNVCLQIDHADGPAVLRDEDGELPAMQDQKYIDTTCGKEYRITGATFQFALNAEAGMITLINVISPSWVAKRLWGRPALTSELPQVRSISDVAWGMWNRVSGGNVKSIKYLMTAMIMNTETREVIREAHGTLEPKRSETAVWPGYDFPTTEKAGQALLGTSVGRWAGYFLLQHKAQLGNKYISKIRVFKPDQGSLPYMLLYIAGPGTAAEGEGNDLLQSKRTSEMRDVMLEARDNGKSILREHVFRIDG